MQTVHDDRKTVSVEIIAPVKILYIFKLVVEAVDISLSSCGVSVSVL